MYEILDEVRTFSSGENKLIFLEAQILEIVREEPDPIERLRSLPSMLTLCQRTLTEAELRKYISLLQIDLGIYWFEASSVFSMAVKYDLVRVTDRSEGSLIRFMPDILDEEIQMAKAVKILEEACLMHAML